MNDIQNRLNYSLLQHIYYQDRIGNKEGFIKYYSNNTDLHEDTKWKICKKLKKMISLCLFIMDKEILILGVLNFKNLENKEYSFIIYLFNYLLFFFLIRKILYNWQMY